MKNKILKFSLGVSIFAFGTIHAAVVNEDGVKHYIPDAAVHLKKENIKLIPHLTEENGLLTIINKDGVPLSIKIDKNTNPEYEKNFKKIFAMQTGGKRKVDKIVLTRHIPRTNIKLVVYVLNGSIIPAYTTEDGKSMFGYSPIINGYGLNRFDYSFIDNIISQVKIIGEAVGGQSRYAKLALNLKDDNNVFKLKKGNTKSGEYYFADPMCPICKETLQQMKKEGNYDKTVILSPAMRQNGIESIMRSAFIIQEIKENNITDSDEVLSVMLKYFGNDSSYPTGAIPDKKYLNIVKNTIKMYLPVTQNNVPYAVPYKAIEKLQDKIAFSEGEKNLKSLPLEN